jgi:hypothetical protein
MVIPRRWWITDATLDDERFKPWHPSLFWQYLVYLAVWRSAGKVIHRDGETVHLERGQFFHTLGFIGKRPGYGKNKVRRELEKLQVQERIDFESKHHGMLVTVKNYDPYQDLEWYLSEGPETALEDFPKKGPKTGRTPGRTPGHMHPTTGPRTTQRRKGDAGRTPGRFVKRGRDVTGNNKKAVQGSTITTALTRGTTSTPSWTSIRAAIKNEIWHFTPASARRQMIVDALGDELPPRDLARFVRDQCAELDLPFPDLLTVLDTDSGEAPTAAPDPEPDHDRDTRTRELADQLRQKLARLKGTRA